MAEFINNDLTDRGRALLAGAQIGAVFQPVSIVLGSGNMPSGRTPASMTAVVTPWITLDINKVERTGDGNVIYGGSYSNADLTEDTYLREIGMFARLYYPETDTYSDTVLYSYGNAGNTADLIPAYGPGQLVERQLNVIVYVGNDTEVSLEIGSGLAISINEKGKPGGIPTLDSTGKVPVVQIPEMDYVKRTGDKMSGDLMIEGGDAWRNFAVTRNNNGETLIAGFGVGSTGGAAMQVTKLDGTLQARADVVKAGLQFEYKQIFAAKADMTDLTSGTILEFANTCLTNTTKMILTYMPADIPVVADGFLEIIMRSVYKMVRFTPFNSPYGAWTRYITNGAWTGDWIRSGQLARAINVYVATTGSDATGNGTEAKPYASIIKALSVLPKDLGGHDATIWIAGGTYNEGRVSVQGFSNGVLYIGASDGSNKPVISNGFLINGCSAVVYVTNLIANGTADVPAFDVYFSPLVVFQLCEGRCVSNTGYAFSVSTLSNICLSECVCDAAAAAVVSHGGRAVVYSLAGNAAVGFSALAGGLIGIAAETGVYVTRYHTEGGGRIYTGAQTVMGSY